MKKWLIIYSSNTGNTKQIATAMYNTLSCGEGDIYPLQEIPADFCFSDYDVIMVGYWLIRGGPDNAVKKLLSKFTNKNIILFQTHGAEKCSEHSITAFARAASCLGLNCNIIGTFSCQGKINPVLLEKRRSVSSDNPHAANKLNEKRWKMALLHPDSNDLKEAALFVKTMKRKLFLKEKYYSQ
ncbi:flavodoxin family protein [Pectinatus sottacetonis]|uniref:flavodoxin family protein n=1 Tax=Pectinatus sottacetonis TaxID=1002795 RepID=UPI0018C82C11|nr:flavodoxin family protein [Pectinatus sottacetonis]